MRMNTLIDIKGRNSVNYSSYTVESLLVQNNHKELRRPRIISDVVKGPPGG
jgi:hypothetical protein